MSGSNRRVDMPSKSSRSQGSDRVSVFSRLGTKGGSSGKTSAPAGERSSSSGPSGVCRQWLETGHCQYQSKCKFASSHSLVSPSKRPDPPSGETRSRKEAAPGTSKKRGENSPEFDLDDLTNWENLDYDDELLLEKKRQLLERELAKQGHPIKATDEDKKESVAGTTAGPPQAKKPKMGPKPPTNQPTQTKKSSGPWTSGVQQPSSNSSSSSSSSSDSDSSSSSDSSSDSSSEPSKKKSKPLPKKVVKPTEDKKKKMSDRKPTKSIGLKGGAPPAKKTSAKSASVSGSKVSRYHPESSDKKKRKIKKVRGSVKRPRSPSTSKSATKRPIGKDDKSQDSKSNPVRKGSERDKFGFYHATAPTSAEGGGSKDAGGSSRGWKPKRPSDQQQRRASLSPSRMNTDSSAKRQKKSIKSVTTTKRSQSNERRGGSSRPPVSRRSSHSPHAKRRPSPKASAAGGSRGGSAGRERDHRPHTNRDEHHRDIRREDSRGKFDRDRKPGATSSNRSHNPPTRENWSRYQGQPPPREERSHKSPGGNRDRGQSPPPRSSAPQSDSRKYKDKIQFSGGNAVRVEPRSEHRDKQHSHSRISRERERSPRDRLLPPEALQRHRGVNKERERSPRERLLSPEGIQRERFNRDQNRFSRERGSNESAPPRERDRERDRGMPDYPKRASPFERLGGPHPGSHKRWEGRASSADRGDNRDAGTSSDKDATLTHSSPKRSETQKKVNPDSGHKEEQDEAKPTQNSPTPSKGETKTDGLMESTSLDTNTKSPPGNDEEKEAAFSDLEINDSDEEILNKNSNENEEEGQLQTSNEAVEEDETEEGEVGGIDSRSSSRKSNLNDASLVPLVTSRSEKQNNDLLEGISDEDLDISEDDDAKSKIADALGVDWSQLMNSKASLSENQSVTDIRKRWTVVSIFNRIGLCSQYLGDDYKKIVEEIKSKAEEGEKLELLHDIGGLHQRIKSLREKRNRYFCPTEPYVIPTKINWAV